MPQDGIVSGQQPAREKKAMKTTLLTIAFAAASLPMFAAQTAPATQPPASGTTDKPAVTGKKSPKKAKTHKTKKNVKKDSTAAPAPVSK
jgi:cell division protein FtsN